MRPLRAIIRERLRALDRTQQWLAGEVGVEGSNLSAILTGVREPPIDKAALWAERLGLVEREAEELEDAMHLAAASERVRALVDRLEAELAQAARALARYRDRAGTIRFLLDYIEPPLEDGGEGRPPPETDAAALIATLNDLVQIRNAIVHGMPLPRRRAP